MLMAADEEEQTEGSILEINVQNVQSPCWLFRHIQNQYHFAINRRLASCVHLEMYYFKDSLLLFCISL